MPTNWDDFNRDLSGAVAMAVFAAIGPRIPPAHATPNLLSEILGESKRSLKCRTNRLKGPLDPPNNAIFMASRKHPYAAPNMAVVYDAVNDVLLNHGY